MGFGFYQFVREALLGTDMPLVIKIGLTGLIVGLVILLISLIKERYQEVKGGKK